MHRLKYTIKTLSPVIISTLSGDRNMVATRQYIPGTAVLGILAARFIKRENLQNAHEDPKFYHWFLDSRLTITNAYITRTDQYGSEFVHYPTPLSLVQEKYAIGRRLAAYNLLHKKSDEIDELKQIRELGRFFNRDQGLTTYPVETEIQFHHARDREKGTSKAGQIFNYEAIAKDSLFTGELLGSKEDLQQVLVLCRASNFAYLGRSRNAQYGKVELTIVDKEPVNIEQQNNRSVSEKRNSRKPISMALVSDLILYNEYGYATTDEKVLEKELQKQLGQGLIMEKLFSRPEVIENFVGVWGLKKSSEVCFAAGSTVLLKNESGFDAKKIAEIEIHGLGERRHEGFGRCVFSQQAEEKIIFQDLSSKGEEFILEKPTHALPALAKEVLEKIVKGFLHDAVRALAQKHLAVFDPKRLPSSTLISKLLMMAKSSYDRSQFVLKLNKMRKNGLDKLRYCVSGEYNLLEFLASFEIPEKSFLIKYDEKRTIGEFCKIQRPQARYTLVKEFSDENRLDEEKHNNLMNILLPQVHYLKDPLADCFKEIRKKYPEFDSFCKEAPYSPQADEQLCRELLASYYESFFSVMRLIKITCKEGAQGGTD